MILIVAAMPEEVNAIVERMDEVAAQSRSGIAFHLGKLKGKEVLVMLSGVGKGNCAIALTIAMEQYPVDAVLNIGTAGGLCADQQVLDLVISEQVVQHDFDTSALDGEEGIGLWFSADRLLIEQAASAAQKLQARYHFGLIASGDRFVAKPAVAALKKRFPHAVCAEMEAGAVAQVCTHYHIPFVVLRSLSDVALREDNAMDFTAYVRQASRRSAELCERFVEQR